MPTYQYRCLACEHEFEVVQSFSDAAIEKCEICGQEVRKIYNNVGVVFKGSGFYKTDSRSSAKPSSTPTSEKKPTESKASASETTSTT